MEIEQQLQDIVNNAKLSYEEKIEKLLDLGLSFYGLGIGIISHVEKGLYTVIFADSPGNMVEVGATFPIGDTYCCHTLKTNGAVGFHHAGISHISAHPCYTKFQLESYIGAPITDGNNICGTINFSAAAPRDPFTQEDFRFIEMLAKWLST